MPNVGGGGHNHITASHMLFYYTCANLVTIYTFQAVKHKQVKNKLLNSSIKFRVIESEFNYTNV